MRVKICGITNLSDAHNSVQYGADALGLVFFEKSPRFVSSLKLAAEIVLSTGPFVSSVGLFVNATKDYIEHVLASVPLSHLQFHGDESPDFCSQFNKPYLKAIRMREEVDLHQIANHYACASGLLLDTYVKGVPGGTGQQFNWDRIPNKSEKKIVLAGGLTPDNVKAAASIPNLYGVDVSGGVEAEPGVKDPIKLQVFIQRAKSESVL